jgi:hypothetical protein
MLHLVGVEEARWEGSGTEPAGECTFLFLKQIENHERSIISFCA